jgi:nucleoside-diphosphate-sugar epimerase
MNVNVFLAAAQLGLRRVVWGSSETTLGLAFDEQARSRVSACLGGAHHGVENLIIAAADTIMNQLSAELLHEVFPDIKLTRDIGAYETLLAIDRARELLGFNPRHSWRDEVTEG